MLSRRLRAALGSVVALGLSLTSARTARADVRVERSDDAASCPDTASFADRVRDGAANEPVIASTRITVRFERTSGGYRSWVSTAGGKNRSLADDAPSCDGLAEATALAVKLALELEANPPAAPAVAPAKMADAGPVTPFVPRGAGPFAEVSASGAAVFGLASPVAYGARAGAALVFGQGHASVGITGFVLPSQTRAIGDGAVDLSALGGGLEGCGRLPIGASLLLALCARLEAVSLDGTARGFARAEDHARFEYAATVLGRARARIAARLALFVEGGAMVPFARERFSIDTVGVVYDPPVVAAATGIGIVVDFE